MDAIILRKVTRKSQVRFGKFALLTFGEVLNLDEISYLKYLYYNIAGLDYDEDLLQAIKIPPHERLQKPAADPQMYEQIKARNRDKLYHCSDIKYAAHAKKRINARKRAILAKHEKDHYMSKADMQRINQGHGGYWK